jgi:hypothetical protein
MRTFAILVTAITVAGCATITKGTTQIVAINTPGAQGATCTLLSGSVGSQTVVTPVAVSLAKGRDNISVHCTKECFQEGVGVIASNLEGMAAGNIIAGGVIGLGVDAVSGAMNSYSPEVQIVMPAIPGCRPPASLPPPAPPPQAKR